METNEEQRELFVLTFKGIMDDVMEIEKKYGVEFLFDGVDIKAGYSSEEEKAYADAATAELLEIIAISIFGDKAKTAPLFVPILNALKEN